MSLNRGFEEAPEVPFQSSVQPRHSQSVAWPKPQFSRAIRKAAPAALSRGFAAAFAHSQALSPYPLSRPNSCEHDLYS